MEKHKNMIPKIIHQIWSGKDGPLPQFLKDWGKTWKDFHPHWQYEFWDNDRMNSFIREFYSEYMEIYDQFPYDIQRWDAIRYLILWKIGGMYVDFDYECLDTFDDLLNGKECCFSMEPACHIAPEDRRMPYFFNNALMACTSNHPFMLAIIKEVFSGKEYPYPASNKFLYVMSTTGPRMLVNTYENYDNKDGIYLIPADWVSPFGITDIRLIMSGVKNEYYEKKLQNAKAIHYFLGSWRF
jgi:mannosyltransferase OCH1-like enzyme